MLDAANTLVTITSGVDEKAYLANRTLQLAAERCIEIIGEAARYVSRSFRDAHPEIQWTKIVAQRHILAHHYGAIQHERLWRVVETHVPALVAQLTPLVPVVPENPADGT
ncbi:MAG: HepT-like ribonuclease domain-containing protein [Phycisphaerae bacterium]|nr:HepT-like ribonuclease domain-containing protein [Phycisphaerae bacterium]